MALITSYVETFERLYRQKVNFLHNIIGTLAAYIVIYIVSNNLPALARSAPADCQKRTAPATAGGGS